MMRRLLMLMAALCCLPAGAADTYSRADFARVAKIDAHLHLHGESHGAWLAQAKKDNFRVLTINVDYPDFPPLAQQRRQAAWLARSHPREVAWAASFAADGFEQAGWLESTLAGVDEAVREGAVGVKVWKNIGMSLRDASGRLAMVDDARFAPLFAALEQRGVLVLGHQGEPHNCWLPLERMTVKSDRAYFRAHPQYHMHRQPHMPSYEDQMAARDRLLARHPRLRFVGVHLASLEWDVERLGRFLDAHPDVLVDVAARIGQVQYQSQREREQMRRFFIAYQDRLIYGSDLAQPAGARGQAAFAVALAKVWRRDWRYFTSAERFAVPELDGKVQGLALPRAVIDKLYRFNAERAFRGGWGGEAAR